MSKAGPLANSALEEWLVTVPAGYQASKLAKGAAGVVLAFLAGGGGMAAPSSRVFSTALGSAGTAAGLRGRVFQA